MVFDAGGPLISNCRSSLRRKNMLQGGLRTRGTVKNPMVSIITVVFNGETFFEHTIKSVIQQNFTDYEYIVVDGGSTDNTINIIKKYEDNIDFWISAPDKGIYDAMNKAIDLANGEWLNFMNAGDKFVNGSVLRNTFNQQIPNEAEFIFSDWFLYNFKNAPEKLYPCPCNFKKGFILHQSVIYKKKLHNEYGKYIVTPKLIISDYLFFCLIPDDRAFMSKVPISINDNTGISSAEWAFQQKMAFDFVFGKYSFNRYMHILLKYRIKRMILYLLPLFVVRMLKQRKQ